MAYTAAALSLCLLHSDKPIMSLVRKLPMYKVRSDAHESRSMAAFSACEKRQSMKKAVTACSYSLPSIDRKGDRAHKAHTSDWASL